MIGTKKILTVCCVLFFMLCALHTAQAQDKQKVTQSMQERYSKLLQAKDQGLVGEAWNGLVSVVRDNVPQNIQDLVEAENKDRRTLFQIVAKETGASVQEVARQNRIRMYRLAKDEHFLQDQNRNWVRKKELN